MLQIVAAVGVLMCAASLIGLAAPASLTALTTRLARTRPLRIGAAVARMLFGAVAIIASNQTPYPLAMKLIGVVAIMGGTIATVVSNAALKRGTERLPERNTLIRGLSLAALGTGAFLVHASL